MQTARKGKLLKYSVIMLLAAVSLSIIGYTYWGNLRSQDDQKQVTRTVRAYNQQLIEALRTLEVEKLQGYVTEKQSAADELYLAYYKEKAQKRELDQLAELTVDKVAIEKSSAEVRTSEIWRVKQESLSTGRITDMGEVNYQTTYTLLKQNGKWLVDSVKSTETGKR